MFARVSRTDDKSSLNRFWFPGAFGSLAAAPTVPGWAYTTCGCVGPRDHLYVRELGDFKERTIGIGPQIGFVIPISEGYQDYLNLRGYRDLLATASDCARRPWRAKFPPLQNKDGHRDQDSSQSSKGGRGANKQAVRQRFRVLKREADDVPCVREAAKSGKKPRGF